MHQPWADVAVDALTSWRLLSGEVEQMVVLVVTEP